MHVVMSIDSVGHRPVEPLKFSKLGPSHILKRVHQPGMKYDLSQAMAQQMTRDTTMVIRKPF